MVFKRAASVTTPLGDALLFHRMKGTEHLGRPFEYQLELLGSDGSFDFQELLGRPMVVQLPLSHGHTRYFHGLVSRFSQSGHTGDHFLYRATLRPWLWFLTKTCNCRIFQNKNSVDIIKTIFREHGFTDFEEKLSSSYNKIEYCVQYRESDYNFVSRIMEHEGIYYYFKHEEQKHVLVLSDSYSAHDSAPGYEEVPYYPPTENVVREEACFWRWDITQEVQSGVVTLNEYDFEKPKAGLLVKSSQSRSHPFGDCEVYDYPGKYLVTGDGEGYARARVEEIQAQFEEITAAGDVRGAFAGALFTLTDHPRGDQNREYLIVSVEHDLQSQEYSSAKTRATGPVYENLVRSIDAKETYRSPRLAQKPHVGGPQTAVVVGKAGEEIWTDKYGRVKIQFHWDREGKVDENSSCWVRVSQPWAGKGWGAVAIPRIGQEVVVDFLEGDPDRPLITGRVYNADNMPPNELPTAGMVSGFKSNSTPGGGGYNEISADDTKGKEKVTIHAQYDMSTDVGHDQTQKVTNNRTAAVGVDESQDVGSNQTLNVGADQTVTIGANQTLSVGAAQSVSVGGGRSVSVTGGDSLTVSASRTISAGASVGVTSGADTKIVAGGPVEVQGANVTIKGLGMVTVDAPMITLMGNMISLLSGGASITVSGGQIAIDGSGPVSINGALVSVTGGLVKVNS